MGMKHDEQLIHIVRANPEVTGLFAKIDELERKGTAHMTPMHSPFEAEQTTKLESLKKQVGQRLHNLATRHMASVKDKGGQHGMKEDTQLMNIVRHDPTYNISSNQIKQDEARLTHGGAYGPHSSEHVRSESPSSGRHRYRCQDSLSSDH